MSPLWSTSGTGLCRGGMRLPPIAALMARFEGELHCMCGVVVRSHCVLFPAPWQVAWTDVLQHAHPKVVAWCFCPVLLTELPAHHKFKEFELCALSVKFEDDENDETDNDEEEEDEEAKWTTYYIVPWFQAPWSRAQNKVTPPIYPQLHDALVVCAVDKLCPKIADSWS